MRSEKELKEKPKQEKSSRNEFEEWAKKEGIRVRVVEGDNTVTAVFKPKKKK